jgi:hypothetical protein
MSNLKAFVRYDGTGRIVSSSIILAKSKPKVGNWTEVDAYECCNQTTTTTTTIDPLCRIFELSNSTGSRVTWSGIDCTGEPYSTGISSGGIPWKIFNCVRTVVGFIGTGLTVTDLGLCYSCKQWELTNDTYPFTYSYIDCNGDPTPKSIEIIEPTTICAQYIFSDSPNVTYIGPCPN